LQWLAGLVPARHAPAKAPSTPIRDPGHSEGLISSVCLRVAEPSFVQKTNQELTVRYQITTAGQTHSSRELGDTELDQVSGGLNPQPLPPFQEHKYFTISFLKTHIPSDPI
jgi:hypothetical protein